MTSTFSQPAIHQSNNAKSSVLRSFMHKRNPSAGTALSPAITTPESSASAQLYNPAQAMQFLPKDHPHYRALGEVHHNQQSPPKKSKEGKRPNTGDMASKSLHKKTLSSISLKSLAGRDTDKVSKSKEKEKEVKPKKPKKTKSSTNLANLLSRPKSSKSLRNQALEDEERSRNNKENRSPTTLPVDAPARPPPIYAQFSSEYFTKQPLGGKFLEDEIDLYTPQQYSPGKQRNFYGDLGGQPTLNHRDEVPQRPKSTFLPSSFSIQDISRRISSGGSRSSAEIVRRVSGAGRPSLDRKTTVSSANSEKAEKASAPAHRRHLREAMSAFTSKPKSREADTDPALDDKDIDREFEAMLDRRNIPEHQRGKMRSLALSMKKDFIKQDWAEIAASKNGRPGTNSSNSSAEAAAENNDMPEIKSKRPRSRTFTLSRANNKEPTSPTKKRPELTLGRHSRTKSTESVKDGSKSLTATSAAVAQNIIAKAKGQLPDDFVSYLRKAQKPEVVEVGRLHKLRLLLRNETVAWTDEFVRQGGMEEIVGLLQRTMEVEWREEHEDALLHEALLCLKALSTTELALQHLNKIQITLFPALLHMVFDEEKKGPSEFTTRNIISSLLFTYLKSAPLSERSHRAMTLLSYLKDPEPSESQRPVGFVLEMHRSRPYRVWCKEVVNVTKEVFWIFLHNLNVIALPNGSNGSSHHNNTDAELEYMLKHFPQELPPVPAAPYVGGVEWDATNYLASHLEILNGIIASLPTREERNQLREQLKVSGWEKCMGITLRLCKEKFYGGVHAGLRCWVAAAAEDGWNTRDVRCGPAMESPRKSPKKGPVEDAPRIDMKLDFGREKKVIHDDNAWL